MPGTVKSELLPDADRSHKCDCQEKVSWKRNLPLDKSHFITETDDVEEGKTFIYISKNKGPLNDERYYSLNALAKEVYGDTSRFISKGIDSLERITTNRKNYTIRILLIVLMNLIWII